MLRIIFFFFFQAEDGIRDGTVTGVQTCALPIYRTRERFSVAATRPETGRINAATEITSSVLVDDVDLRPDALAFAIVTGPETRRSQRSRAAVYQRQFRRTQWRGSFSPQHRR